MQRTVRGRRRLAGPDQVREEPGRHGTARRHGQCGDDRAWLAGADVDGCRMIFAGAVGASFHAGSPEDEHAHRHTVTAAPGPAAVLPPNRFAPRGQLRPLRVAHSDRSWPLGGGGGAPGCAVRHATGVERGPSGSLGRHKRRVRPWFTSRFVVERSVMSSRPAPSLSVAPAAASAAPHPSARRLALAMGGLVVTDLVGGVLAVLSGVNTWSEAWGPAALLAAPAPMVLGQVLLTLVAAGPSGGCRLAGRPPRPSCCHWPVW